MLTKDSLYSATFCLDIQIFYFVQSTSFQDKIKKIIWLVVDLRLARDWWLTWACGLV